MKYWKVTLAHNWNDEVHIEEIEIDRTTLKSVWINGRRHLMRTEEVAFVPTYKKALNVAVSNIKERLTMEENTLRQAQRTKDTLTKQLTSFQKEMDICQMS